MATKFRDGFDFYGSLTELPGNQGASSSLAALSASTRFSVGQSLRLAISGATGATTVLFPFNSFSTDTVFINFSHMRTAGVGGSTAQHRMVLADGSTAQVSWTFDSSGDMRFFRGDFAVLLGTYTGAYPGGGVWNHFQIKVVIGDGVAGSIEVRRDGSDFNDFELLGIDTKTSANFSATILEVEVGSSGPDTHSIDDLWVVDSGVVTGEPVTWLGDVRAVQIMPNSDSIVALSRSSGTTNFSNVDELINSSVDYVFGSAAGLADEYGNAGFSAPIPDVIQGLSVRSVALKTDAGPRTVGVRVRSGATVLDSTGHTVTSAALNYPDRYDLNPNTGLAWTAAELAAMTFGPRIVT